MTRKNLKLSAAATHRLESATRALKLRTMECHQRQIAKRNLKLSHAAKEQLKLEKLTDAAANHRWLWMPMRTKSTYPLAPIQGFQADQGTLADSKFVDVEAVLEMLLEAALVEDLVEAVLVEAHHTVPISAMETLL